MASTLSSTFLGRLTWLWCLSTSSSPSSAYRRLVRNRWVRSDHVQCGGHLGGGPALIYLEQDAGPGNRLCGTPPSPDHLPEPSLYLVASQGDFLLVHTAVSIWGLSEASWCCAGWRDGRHWTYAQGQGPHHVRRGLHDSTVVNLRTTGLQASVSVIPAKAGIQNPVAGKYAFAANGLWIPAFAGMTVNMTTPPSKPLRTLPATGAHKRDPEPHWAPVGLLCVRYKIRYR